MTFMNDKIKELEQKALEHEDLYSYDKERFIEIFAELIVQECIEACNENNKQVQAHLGVSACVKSIKQHFGVDK